MISLKRHMEMHQERAVEAAIDCCKVIVKAMAGGGAQACPAIGDEFQRNLSALSERLSASAGAEAVEEAGRQIEAEVGDWGERASGYYREKAAEIREIMLAMTEAAKAVTQRDQSYRSQFNEVSAKLRTIDALEDLGAIKKLVRQTASDLQSRAEKMVVDGEQSVSGLKSRLAAYERKLEEAEARVESDSLTGLLNKAGVERGLNTCIEAGGRFSLLVADLNGFKALNDTRGHVAGDEVLKAFAAEFKAQFRPTDRVGRWGGDEFVAVVEAGPEEMASRIERVRKWAFGEYQVKVEGRVEKVHLTAALGVAQWRPGMSAKDLFSEADKAMYEDKRRSKKGS